MIFAPGLIHGSILAFLRRLPCDAPLPSVEFAVHLFRQWPLQEG